MINKNEKIKSLETLLVLVGAFVIFFWVWEKKIFLLLALILVIIGVSSTFLTNIISWIWMKFAERIGNVMSKILLSVVFFIFLFPLAVLYRVVKKDFLSLKRKQTTYYIMREHQYSPKDIENIW